MSPATLAVDKCLQADILGVLTRGPQVVKAEAALSIFVFNILVNAFGATAITPG